MKIVLLTSKLNFKTAGGSVMDLHLKALGLQKAGHEVAVITAFSYANVLSETLPYRVHEEMVLRRGLIGIQYHAFRILRKYSADADVFYIDGHIFCYGGGFYRLLNGKPVVAFFNVRLTGWLRGSGYETASLPSRIKKLARLGIERAFGVFLANRLDAFIFNTPQLQRLYRAFGFSEKKSSVVEDFVDMRDIVERYGISRDTVSQRQSKRPVTFYSTGRMLKEKGFELLIRAFAHLQNREQYHLVISGAGPDKERIEELAETLGISEYVSFPGWVDKEALAHLFLDSHVFVFPKWWLEYGSALLTEALAFGCACIIPGGGALEWLVQKSADTFVHDDYRDLAQRMEALAVDEQARTALGTRALQRVETLDCRELSKRLNAIVTSVSQAR